MLSQSVSGMIVGLARRVGPLCHRGSLPEADGDLGTRREGPGRTPPANELGKSHRPIVPTKPVNKVGEETTAEPVEGRGLAKENASQRSTHRTQSRARVSQELEGMRQAAKRDKGEKFTALLHHVTKDRLGEAYWELNKKAAAGVDGVTWEQCGANLEENLQELHQRLHRGAYRAPLPASVHPQARRAEKAAGNRGAGRQARGAASRSGCGGIWSRPLLPKRKTQPSAKAAALLLPASQRLGGSAVFGLQLPMARATGS